MKLPIIINIGLNTNDNQPLPVHVAILALASQGFTILTSRVCDSPAGNEKCLVVSALWHGSEEELSARGFSVSNACKQDCIAIYTNGQGVLLGINAEDWRPFQSAFFVLPSGETLGEFIQEYETDLDDRRALAWLKKLA